jgi:hypothetical protein
MSKITDLMKTRLVFSLLLFLVFHTVAAQESNPGGGIRIYSYPMDPRHHPDDGRRAVKPPDNRSFGNRVQFMALRSLDGNFNKLLDQYTLKYKLGNIIWPAYPVLFQSNLPEIVTELKRRNLYLFDLWGFVPGSGPGGYWQQFTIPEHVTEMFEKELGDHWLGMDNGEQDGRYVGGYASQLQPAGGSRETQYLNFQNHFQGLTDRLGNKMATLVSLNFGHYFLKEGVYTMIGAETAQGLPNTQIYYSFIRGAGKQYGVPWFGNASVWNRWGWKNYSGISDYNGGDTKGTSLSLLKRLIYTHMMYNCSAVGFEASFLNKKDELSPVGRIQQSANLWVEKNGNPGILYTPVGIMLDFFSGWSFPRHLYTDNIFRVWGNLPYAEGDYLTDNVLELIYPGYRDASFFHDESGFITPTPFGDAADCILSDSPLWILQQYPVLVVAGSIRGGNEIKDKLENYIRSGGALVITAGNLKSLPAGLCGITATDSLLGFEAKTMVTVGNDQLIEKDRFNACILNCRDEHNVLASAGNFPLAIEKKYGEGTITVLASPFGLPSETVRFTKPGEDQKMATPYPFLSHSGKIIGKILRNTMIFDPSEGLGLITCRKAKGEYTLAICNSGWKEKPYTIKSSAGRILKITELKTDCSERSATGFLPESVSQAPGQNSPGVIAGGDIRIFRVLMDEKAVTEIPFIQPKPNPSGIGLTLRNISSLKHEILLRPTFFQNYDIAVIDWKYLAEREADELRNQSGWIKNQGLKVFVDLTSGINLFPDLRIVNNDSVEYGKSMRAIGSLLEKMKIFGTADLIVASHRTIENNFTDEQFSGSLKSTLKIITREAAGYGIRVHYRPVQGRFAPGLEEAINLVKAVGEPNLYVAPSLAALAGGDVEKNRQLLGDKHVSSLFIASPAKDLSGKIYSLNQPLAGSAVLPEAAALLKGLKDKVLIIDGIYHDKDAEYLDARELDQIKKY